MTETAHLWLFFGLVFGVVVLPGLDMAFVLGSALVGGRKAGLAAVGGLIAGGVCHVTMGATGIAVALELFPAAFNAMLLAGAAYVGFMGLSLWRGARALGPSVDALPERRSSWDTFVRAAVTNLLNPKAYVFMLAVFPQFLRPEYGPLAVQALALGAITAVTQAGVYGAVALLAGSVRGWFLTHPSANRAMARGVGALLILVAAVTLVEGWRRA